VAATADAQALRVSFYYHIDLVTNGVLWLEATVNGSVWAPAGWRVQTGDTPLCYGGWQLGAVILRNKSVERVRLVGQLKNGVANQSGAIAIDNFTIVSVDLNNNSDQQQQQLTPVACEPSEPSSAKWYEKLELVMAICGASTAAVLLYYCCCYRFKAKGRFFSTDKHGASRGVEMPRLEGGRLNALRAPQHHDTV
jgi:hypothetical protein